MQGMKYLYELFLDLPRGGPGDNRYTKKAFSYLKKLPYEPLILDIGCGHGMQTIELARISKANIIALDNYQPFLDILMQNAKKIGVNDRITLKNQSMLEMDFENDKFDVIWCEGAIFVMGFKTGLKKCYKLLKNNGFFVVSEAVLFMPNIPKQLKEFWDEQYPDIMDIKGNISLIESQGFEIVSHFTLPKSCWIDFYLQMDKKTKDLKKKYHDNKNALKIFEGFERESKMYDKYSDYYGYEFFIMQKK